MTQTMTGAYPAPREDRGRKDREAFLLAYHRWRLYAAEVESQTGLRPEPFRTLEGSEYQTC